MAQITFDLPVRVIAGICGKFGYTKNIYNDEGIEVPNPETRIKFVKRTIRVQAIRAWVVDYEKREQRKAIDVSVQEDFDANVNIG